MDSPATKNFAPNTFIEVNEDVVILRVGAGDKQRHFVVSRSLLCDRSPVLKAKLDHGLLQSVSSFDLLEDDPDIFVELLRWLSTTTGDSGPVSASPGSALSDILKKSNFARQLGPTRQASLLEVLEEWRLVLINWGTSALVGRTTKFHFQHEIRTWTTLFTSDSEVTENFETIMKRLSSNDFSSTTQIEDEMNTLKEVLVLEFGESTVVRQCEMIIKDIELHTDGVLHGCLHLGILAEKYQILALADICMSEMLSRSKGLPTFTPILSTYKATTKGSKFRTFMIRAFIYQIYQINKLQNNTTSPKLCSLMFDPFEFGQDVFKYFEENGQDKTKPLLLPACDFHNHAKHEACPASTEKSVTATRNLVTTQPEPLPKVVATPRKRGRLAEEGPVRRISDSPGHKETTLTTPQASTSKRRKI